MSPIYENPNMVWPKIWPVIGNHEAQHPEDEDNFRKAFPNVYNNGPDDEKGLSYSFDFNNSHFTFVSTDRWFYGDPNDSTDDRRDWHYVKHIDWLEEDLRLANERGVDHIFIVSHDMIYPVGIKGTSPSYHTMNFVSFGKQKLCQIRAILTGDAGN